MELTQSSNKTWEWFKFVFFYFVYTPIAFLGLLGIGIDGLGRLGNDTIAGICMLSVAVGTIPWLANDRLKSMNKKIEELNQ